MNACQTCSRRKFLGGLAAAGSVLGGLLPAPAHGEDGVFTDPNSVLRLKLADFAALANPGGSVVLTHNSGASLMMVNRGPGDTIHVMDPTCTHQGCRVDRYNAASLKIVCPCHGSTYAIDGEVTQGPAGQNLKTYPSRLTGGILEIQLPEFEFGITAVAFERTAAGVPRLALSFAAQSGCVYRIRRSADPGGPFLPVSFALEKEDPLNHTEHTGVGGVISVYVDAAGPRAFHQLELMVFDVS